MDLPDYLENAMDRIDAAVFSGDALQEEVALDRFEWYLARWRREMVRLHKIIRDDDGCMGTGKLPPETHYACREIAAERDKLRTENQALMKCCCQRGARMQILWEWMGGELPGDWPVSELACLSVRERFLEQNQDRRADLWFDEDGVPVD